MKKAYLTGVAIVGVIAVTCLVMRSHSASAEPATVAPAGVSDIVAAGPGRVEGISEEIRVSSQIGGRLAEVLVEEGDAVKAGQIIAVVENTDFKARLASAEAALALKEAALARVRNGARVEEKRDAAAAVREAEAVLEHAQKDVERRRQLFRDAVIAQAELDASVQNAKVAQARLDALTEKQRVVETGARAEDRAAAEAEVALARAAVAEARATLERTITRAPIDGIVFRKFRRPGESVSTQFDSPIVTVADRSTLRVRMEVDEADVARLRVGQRAYVTADAFGDRKFEGRVVRVGQLLGRKNIRTDEPAERADQKVLETLIELTDGRELPLGLRVQAYLLK
jgi:HlyD family secretion protein